MKPFVCCLLLLMSSLAFGNNKSYKLVSDTLTAQSIFNKSEAVYANLKVYLDSGKVIQEMDVSPKAFKTAKLFKTAYTNNGQFNFEYYELGKSNSLYVVNKTSGIVKTWWGLTNENKTATSLNMALSGVLGVSSRSSYLIPTLLLVNDFKKQVNIYHTTHNAILKGTELINGVNCYKIDGEEREKGKVILWIAKKDFLIRKIYIENIVNSVRTQAVVSKMDSIVRSRHLHDTAYLRKRAETEAPLKTLLTKYKSKLSVFTAKTSYFFAPYTTKKVNPNLFKFRPNREVAL